VSNIAQNRVYNAPIYRNKVYHNKAKNPPKPSARSCANGPVGAPLDTLAQLPTKGGKEPYNGKNSLKKRARSKWYTQGIIGGLLYLDSPLHKYYQSAYYCSHVVSQRGQKFTSKYCNTRVCHICNRIRTAKMISGYLKQYQSLSGVYFLTLTIKNVKGSQLRSTISEMTRQFSLIIRVLAERRGKPVSGVRKIECTYNPITDEYHPHLHALIDRDAQEIIDMWLKRFPKPKTEEEGRTYAERDWQECKPADINTLKELFKYTTKLQADKLQKGKGIQVYLNAIDTIMKALYGKRTMQPFGKIKKVNEEVEELDAQLYEDMPEYTFIEWVWEKHDWHSQELNNVLTGYQPPDIEVDLIY
jgi:hypothetical protein